MKAKKLSLLILAICAGLTSAANAVPVVVNLTAPPIGDIAKNGTGIGGGNGNSAADNFFRLQQFFVSHPELETCTPIFDGAVRFENLNGSSPNIDVTGFAYAVIHYGVGMGGIPASGGGVEIFSITGDGFYTFPTDGSGPNGFGGISSIDLFKCAPMEVPDSGATLMLLGTACAGLGLVHRNRKRQQRVVSLN